MNTILLWLTTYLPCRKISRDGTPYLERYYILPFIYLHRFISSDGDKDIHDHPWLFAFSFVLSGAYSEEVLTGCYGIQYRTHKWFNFIKGKKFHRIFFTEPNTWTLFIVGPRYKVWRFLDLKTNTYTPMKHQRRKYPRRGSK